ncbi:hypothetical protein [Nannocystis pusilla]|uniref:Uncharacterized protein n=1 Tax=Nannocystis pusilla TaxID=889268 RepID=A0ABS7TXZ3_9BACT|nr:hypothetical protein [Nannocystis pusilla]MBZ5713021.1 hypothetical protein [Nannocystis pusilla]
MQAKKQKRPSERFKRKVLARWRWLAARGMDLEQAASEIGVAVADLSAWSRGQEVEAPLLVPVQVEVESTTPREIVVVLAGGVRIEGLSVAEVVELVRRLP